MLGRTAGIAILCLWSSQIQAADPVRIAHQEHFPPFIEIKDGRSTGLVVAIVRAAAAKAEIEVQFVPFLLHRYRTR
jgi:hypothetical protein